MLHQIVFNPININVLFHVQTDHLVPKISGPFYQECCQSQSCYACAHTLKDKATIWMENVKKLRVWLNYLSQLNFDLLSNAVRDTEQSSEPKND